MITNKDNIDEEKIVRRLREQLLEVEDRMIDRISYFDSLFHCTDIEHVVAFRIFVIVAKKQYEDLLSEITAIRKKVA